MSNKDIANAFDELANLLELHDDNEFKIRSYRNAYLTLRKLDQPLSALSDAEIKLIKGIGPAIAGKIRELLSTGKMKALEEAHAETPAGVVEMLQVNGFGPKKVRTVWKEMGIESTGELWYACNENRLIEYKGFGLKTQDDLKAKLEYFFKSRDKMHCDAAAEEADFVCTLLTGRLAGAFVSPVGEVRRRCPVVERVEILIGFNSDLSGAFDDEVLVLENTESTVLYMARLENRTTVRIHRCMQEEFGSKLFQLTGRSEFIDAFVKENPGVSFKGLRAEQDVFDKAGMPFVAPELRESSDTVQKARQGALPVLVEMHDLKGVLHVHTTWSDGLHSLREMCAYARDEGYEYIGITDHSQSAFYANGLKPDRVLAQMAEIDALNEEMRPFRIFKGIESDILSDGSLDYDDDILARFDFVIASVHSNLKMSREKATERILRAIENPYTRILGHPTGRLLLSREGYPLDWDAVFDACVRHKVAIELNANPYRLDLDYTLIPEATRRGIPICINPDAHSKEGMHDILYGIQTARKGGLTAAQCPNALSAAEWAAYLKR
jgi:DNA polymerase (family 10)